MSLLTPEPGLVFWMTIAFGIVLFVLAKFAFPKILNAVWKRKGFIDESLKSAEIANKQLDSVKETGDKILAEAQKQHKEIIMEAAAIKEKILVEARERAEVESSMMIKRAQKEIAEEKDKALLEIHSEVSALSLQLTEMILRKKLSTEEEQMLLNNRLLDSIKISKS